MEKLTADRLDLTLRMCSIELHTILLEKLIDVVHLIQDKGDKVNIEDVVKLQREWNNKSTPSNDVLSQKNRTGAL